MVHHPLLPSTTNTRCYHPLQLMPLMHRHPTLTATPPPTMVVTVDGSSAVGGCGKKNFKILFVPIKLKSEKKQHVLFHVRGLGGSDPNMENSICFSNPYPFNIDAALEGSLYQHTRCILPTKNCLIVRFLMT